jgi:hypothetical protein
MIITDYESGRNLSDIGLTLTVEEAQELREYLTRLIDEPSISHAYLTEVSPNGLEKEIAIRIAGPRPQSNPKKLPLPRTRNLSVA